MASFGRRHGALRTHWRIGQRGSLVPLAHCSGYSGRTGPGCSLLGRPRRRPLRGRVRLTVEKNGEVLGEQVRELEEEAVP
jgi:hypothetical protein